jgi:hypothetical protein
VIVEGIFVDEVPSSTMFVQYMAKIATTARRGATDVETDEVSKSENPRPATSGEGNDGQDPSSTSGKGPWTVIYNPGVVVDPTFYQDPDYVVAFENLAKEWVSGTVRSRLGRLPEALLRKSVAIVHSAASPAQLARIGAEAHGMGFAGQFVTTQAGYTAWSPSWTEYARDTAEGWRVPSPPAV